MGQGNIVVFSFGTFFGKVFSKDRIPVADVLGCVVKGMSQVAGATFFHVSIAVREFSGLVCLDGEQPKRKQEFCQGVLDKCEGALGLATPVAMVGKWR